MGTATSSTDELRWARAREAIFLPVLIVLTIAACDAGDPTATVEGTPGERFPDCTLNPDLLYGASARDAIPALDEPAWSQATRSVPDYLDPDTRIIGVRLFGQSYAIPHSVLWHHEVVNLDPGGPEGGSLAITYCPLTGSSLVFDRRSVGGATLGVSGLLFMNNLVLFARGDPSDTRWPQMLTEAGCGSGAGTVDTELAQHPFVEMQWADWRELHPSTLVLSGAEAQGFDPALFDYSSFGYPYGNYEEVEPFFIGRMMPPVDERRFPKERVVGAPSTAEDPGIAFPFGALEQQSGSHQTVEFMYEGKAALLFWSDEARGGAVFRPMTTDGDALTLRATASGFEDQETGSRWSLEGEAVSGPLEGSRLVPLEETHTAFWGAWAAFHPETRLWEG